MNQVQSYLSTVLRGKMTINEVRVFLGIVKQCQGLIRAEEKARPLQGRRISDEALDYRFLMQIADIIPESSHHYAEARTAIKRLMSKVVESYDSEQKRWSAGHLIDKAEIDSRRGSVWMQVSSWVFSAILDFSIGAPKRYSLENALRITKGPTLRLYMLLWNQTQDMTIKIEALKKMLGVENKYKQTPDFLKRCIDPAMVEMEKLGINGFTYDKLKVNATKTSAIKCLRFHPVKRELGQSLPQTVEGNKAFVIQALKERVGFSPDDFSKFKGLIDSYSKILGAKERLDKIIERQRAKGKNKYYVAAAMKSEVEG